MLPTPSFSNFVNLRLTCFQGVEKGWTGNEWVYDHDIIDLHMSRLETFVPDGRCCVFYATRHQVY